MGSTFDVSGVGGALLGNVRWLVDQLYTTAQLFMLLLAYFSHSAASMLTQLLICSSPCLDVVDITSVD